MTKFLSLIFSFCLLIMQVGPAYGRNLNKNKAQTTNEKGEYRKDQNQGESKKKLINTILMFSVGFVGVLSVIFCQAKPASLYLFYAASLVYIYAEVSEISNNKKKSKETNKTYEENEYFNKQADAFDAQAELKENNANSHKKKAKLQKLAGVGYLAAGAMAIIEGIILANSLGSASTNLVIQCQTKGAAIANLYSPRQSQHYVALEKLIMPAAKIQRLEPDFLDSIVNLFLPSAHGGLGSIVSGGAGGLLAALVKGKKAVASAADPLLSTPYTRAALFIGFGAVTTTIAKQNDDSAKELEKEAAQLRDTARRLRAAEEGAYDRTTALKQLEQSQPEQAPAEQNGELCFVAGSRSDGLGLDENCQCLQTKSCLKISVKDPQIPNQLAGLSIPPSVLEAKALSVDGANKLATGNVSGATVSAGSLDNLAVRLGKDVDGLKKNANNVAKQLGRGAFDFEEAQQKAIRSLEDNLTQAKNAGGNVLEQLSKDSLFKDLGPQKKIKEQKVLKSKLELDLGQKGPSNGLNLDYGSIGQEQEESESLSQLQAQAAKDYHIETKDVAKDNGASLWKIISNRYIRSIPMISPGKKK